jgi:hypothetical protein
MSVSNTLEKFKRVVESCVHLEQIPVAERWCNRFILEFYPYPDDNFELLRNYVRALMKEKNEKITKKVRKQETKLAKTIRKGVESGAIKFLSSKN